MRSTQDQVKRVRLKKGAPSVLKRQYSRGNATKSKPGMEMGAKALFTEWYIIESSSRRKPGSRAFDVFLEFECKLTTNESCRVLNG